MVTYDNWSGRRVLRSSGGFTTHHCHWPDVHLRCCAKRCAPSGRWPGEQGREFPYPVERGCGVLCCLPLGLPPSPPGGDRHGCPRCSQCRRPQPVEGVPGHGVPHCAHERSPQGVLELSSGGEERDPTWPVLYNGVQALSPRLAPMAESCGDSPVLGLLFIESHSPGRCQVSWPYRGGLTYTPAKGGPRTGQRDDCSAEWS